MNKKIILLLLLGFYGSTFAQNETINDYVRDGLQNNLELKQKNFSLQKSVAALDEARGMFFPSIGINARYSKAGGGRTFEIPVGDLVNPIYSGLNNIIGQQVYPTNLPNERINFLRETEHETKISLIQPIFQPRIFFNHKIKNNLVEIEQIEKDRYAQYLEAEIKKAYFAYLKVLNIEKLLIETEKLLNENLRVSKSLYENDKQTIDIVYRAEAELSNLFEQKLEIGMNKTLAQSYFNFLLNREQDSEIIVSGGFSKFIIPDKTEALNNALQSRRELALLNAAIKTQDSKKSLEQSNYYPGIVLAVDYGFQGEEYKFTSEDDFWMASLVMQWNIFSGFRDRAKVEQTEIEKKTLALQLNQLLEQIKMEVNEAHFSLQTADQKRTSAEKRLMLANKTFEIVSKKYKEGMASQIEFIEARTRKTEAEINKTTAQFDYESAIAEFERVTAKSILENE